jgi:hypothetical protein
LHFIIKEIKTMIYREITESDQEGFIVYAGQQTMKRTKGTVIAWDEVKKLI